MNKLLATNLLQKLTEIGVRECCLCPGARNAPLVTLLNHSNRFQCYFWFEERSAAFFAVGRSRSSGAPVAVVTTSGTAAAELLPATIEAHYLGVPLLLITADRPRRFRLSGSPQAIEQVGLFGDYAHYAEDLAENDDSHLEKWVQHGPAHVNICFEEPLHLSPPYDAPIKVKHCPTPAAATQSLGSHNELDKFLHNAKHPLVIVGALDDSDREEVLLFLQALRAPVYLEATSGLRSSESLEEIRITRSEKLLHAAASSGYALDAILRIGNIPTIKLWRELEGLNGKISVLSLSRRPFPGLSWAPTIEAPLDTFLASFSLRKSFHTAEAENFISNDQHYQKKLQQLIASEPLSEVALFQSISQKIPQGNAVYLGNSLPIRQWDLAASYDERYHQIYASRGANGIDGQLSTFLGLCCHQRGNWAILGDLTTLYDMAAPWVMPQLKAEDITIAIINNGGGQIFARHFEQKEFLHQHSLSFAPLAAMWHLQHLCWERIPESMTAHGRKIIEIIPDNGSSARFWSEFDML